MSVVTIRQGELKTVLENLVPFFPSGSKEVPIGFHFHKKFVTVVCLQGIVYQAKLDIVDGESTTYCTILYHNIAPLLETSGLIRIETTPISLSISGGDFEVEFPFGYSDVEEQDIPEDGYKPITTEMYHNGFKTILNLGLDALYKVSPSVQLQNDVTVHKFPNVWVQVRTPGVPICAAIDKEHLRLIQRFRPTRVCDAEVGVLTFTSENSVLQIPCSAINSDSSIVDLLPDMDKVVTLNVGNYLDRIKVIAKVTNTNCTISVYEKGLSTSMRSGNVSITLNCGVLDGELLNSVSLPLQLWVTFLKCIETDVFQILVGGGKICLRTQSTIIVTRVLC